MSFSSFDFCLEVEPNFEDLQISHLCFTSLKRVRNCRRYWIIPFQQGHLSTYAMEQSALIDCFKENPGNGVRETDRSDFVPLC